MPIFEFLPEVGKFCFCISLKTGCIIIGVYYLLSCIFCTSFMPFDNPCYANMDKKDCPVKSILRVLNYISDILFVVVFVSCIIFLVGIFLEKRIFITVFLFAIFIGTVYYFLALVVLILASAMSTQCGFDKVKHTSCLMTALITLLITLYFVIVVKSYRSSLEE